jgi:hypothetical protein
MSFIDGPLKLIVELDDGLMAQRPLQADHRGDTAGRCLAREQLEDVLAGQDLRTAILSSLRIAISTLPLSDPAPGA